MNRFDTIQHTMTPSADGSFTAYSKEYEEHYHSTKDGALQESLQKHIIPAYKHHQKKGKKQLYILDICYGLGFNTLATILYYKEHAPDVALHIYSPELDANLIESLCYFQYPQHFESMQEMIACISKEQAYDDENLHIEVFVGDAREYILKFEDFFDIVYQDPFSPSSNPILWTKEYFHDIKKTMHTDAILTTYSTALKTRLALYENGFHVYLNAGEGFRNATLASLEPLDEYVVVDMEHKIACNSDVRPLYDSFVK